MSLSSGGEAIVIGGERAVSVATLKAGFESWFPAYMRGAN